jgi:MFS family permease
MKWPDALTPKLETDPSGGGGHDIWLYSIVNAVTYFTAALVGTWISDPLQELLFGRRAALFVAALAILASSLGSGFVRTVYQLLGTRVVLGVGMGCKASVIPIYSAEISPGRIRGTTCTQ